MKRKKSGSDTTDLKSFLEGTAAKKKHPEPKGITPSTNES
jgi:hypothetical protein